MAAQMQMTDAIAMEPIMPSMPTLPVAFRIMVAISRVAMVMPETGLLELPIMPTIRAETVEKKKPKITISRAPSGLTGIAGASQMMRMMSRMPPRIKGMGMSFSVREVPEALPPFMLFMASRKVDAIRGRLLISEMIPPVAMAPAPIYLT